MTFAQSIVAKIITAVVLVFVVGLIILYLPSSPFEKKVESKTLEITRYDVQGLPGWQPAAWYDRADTLRQWIDSLRFQADDSSLVVVHFHRGGKL